MSLAGYEDQQLRDLVTSIGGHTEVFLKTVIMPSIPARATLNDCINQLEGLGVVEADRNTLHQLRQRYNDCKHEPSYSPPFFELQALIPAVASVFQRLGLQNLGLSNQAEKLVHKQVLWLAAWDHFIGGDTEVQVMVPTTQGWPSSIDLVYVEMMAWDTIKDLLAASGTIKPGKEAIPNELYTAFAAEGDFHDAFAYQGEYRTVVTTLAAFERREDLIPFLLRENDMNSMIQAFCLASIDIANTKPSLGQPALAKAISQHAVDSYAVPDTFTKLGHFGDQFAVMLEALNENDREVLGGPIWTDVASFDASQESAVAVHPSLRILVDETRTLRIGAIPKAGPS